MKNWIIGIAVVFLLIYMCNGDDSSDVNEKQLIECVWGFVDARIYDVEIESVKRVEKTPPTYKFKYSYYYNAREVKGTGYCTLDENGNINKAWNDHRMRTYNYK